MKISEAIAQLQAIEDNEGDLDLIVNMGLFGSISDIYIHEDTGDKWAVIGSKPIH